MALPEDNYGAVTVTTTPVAIAWGGVRRGRTVTITNGAATIYLGTDSSVNASTGTPLVANEKIQLPLSTDERVFAYCASTSDVRVIQYGTLTY